jgi:two-component system cell cycle response regulator
LGLTADLFDCAEEALKSLATTRYDLVLTDYLLAGQGTGLSLIRAIRSENNHGAPLSILAMSSMDDPARKIEILRAGANDFVVKPILKEELEVRIRNLLTMKQLFDRLNDQHQAMRELSLRDPLTSLHNRYHLMEQVPKIIETARQTKKPLSMLVIDIDHFKVVNDTYGHSTGDVVLVNTSEALRGFISNNMLLVRYGGEEFVMLFPGVNLRQAMAGAERIRERLASLNPGGIPITASFGAAEWHPDESFDELFRRADACVYEAKAGGRNQVVGK